MKIALLSHEGGGISTVSNGLAKALAKERIETTIFTAAPNFDSRSESVSHYLKIVHLPLWNLPPRVLWFSLLNSRRLKYLLADYDVIHAVSPDIGFSFVSSKEPPHKNQFVTTLHGSPRAAMKSFVQSPLKYWVPSDFAFHVLELPLHEKTIAKCFEKSAEVVTCSYATLAELENYEDIDASKTRVIYNGVDLDEIRSETSRIEPEHQDSELTLIYAGRLFWTKGVKFALDAFENLRGQFSNLKLKIFGRGPMQSELLHLIERKGLRGSVVFGGALPHGELIREIAKSDVAIFPSLYESQPMFVLEAMACRKTVVAFDLPYSRELIMDGQTGLLAKTRDLNDLSNKISLSLSDKELRLRIGANANRYVYENHDWKTQAAKYVEVYREIQ